MDTIAYVDLAARVGQRMTMLAERMEPQFHHLLYPGVAADVLVGVEVHGMSRAAALRRLLEAQPGYPAVAILIGQGADELQAEDPRPAADIVSHPDDEPAVHLDELLSGDPPDET